MSETRFGSGLQVFPDLTRLDPLLEDARVLAFLRRAAVGTPPHRALV